MSGLGHQRKLRLLVATSALTPETGCIAALLVHALTLLRRNYDLRLDHERGESAVATGDLGLPDHGGAAAMKRGALGARRLADRYRAEEIGLAFDRRRARATRQIGHGRDAAEIVGKRHARAAVQNVRNSCELLARGQFGLHALWRNVRELDAEKRGEGCIKTR